jgi:hypothetical protein
MGKKARTVYIVFMLLIVAAKAAGETAPDVAGFNKESYGYYFDRADRELSPDAWMAVARQGIALARGVWEKAALGLYGDGERLEAAGRSLADWTEGELEERYGQWLMKRFFGEGWAQLADTAAAGIGAAEVRYSFHLDGEGEVLYDGETGDPLVIRPHEEGTDLEGDRQALRDAAGAYREEAVQSYQVQLSVKYPELLTYIDESRRAAFGARLAAMGNEALRLHDAELAARTARAERLMVARRTGDVWSLRRQSEGEAASAIIGRLIEETNARCDEGIASLAARIEAADGGAGDLALAGEAWLEAYREQFGKGLSAWEEAEERFFQRRMEWEGEAQRLYTESEAAWSQSYETLLVERQRWEAKAKQLFESGEKLFKDASDKLGRAITEARAEFEAEAARRKDAGSQRAAAWAETYLSCAQVMLGAQESVEYWIKKLNSEGMSGDQLGSDAYDAWFTGEFERMVLFFKDEYAASAKLNKNNYSLEYLYNDKEYGTFKEYAEVLRIKSSWTEERLKQEIEAIQEAIRELVGNDEGGNFIRDTYTLLNRRLASLQRWYNKFSQEQAKAASELAGLERDHALWFVLDGSDEEKLMGLREIQETLSGVRRTEVQAMIEARRWTDLYTRYREKALDARNALIADFNLVMGEGGLADILEAGVSSEDFNLDEYQIELIRAKAVAGYWEKRLEIARAVAAYAADLTAGRITDSEGVVAWENAKAAYDAALAFYQEAQEGYAALGGNVAAKQAELGLARDALKEADKRLEDLNKQYALELSVYIVGNNDFILNELVSEYRRLCAWYESTEGRNAYITYIAKARDLGVAQGIEDSAALFKEIVAGSEGRKSLAALAAEVEEIVAVDAAALPQAIADYGIAIDNPYYGVLENLLAAWRDSQESAAKDRYGSLIVSVSLAAKAWAESRVESRIASLELLRAGSLEAWYGAYGGVLDPAKSVEARLAEDYETGQKRFLDARVALELEALKKKKDSELEVSGQAALVSGLALVDESLDIELAIEALTNIRELLSGNNREALYAAAEADGYVLYFLEGNSFFAVDGAVTGSLAGEALNNALMSGILLESYLDYGAESAAGEKASVRAGLSAIRSVFEEYGYTLEEAELPAMKELAGTLALMGEEEDLSIDRAAAELFIRLDRGAETIPAWAYEAYQNWKNAFSGYLAERAAQHRGGDLSALEEIQEAITGTAEEFAGVMEAYESIAGAGGYYGELAAGILEEELYVLSVRLAALEYRESIVKAALAAAEEGDHWRMYITGSYLGTYNARHGEGERIEAAPEGNPEETESAVRGAARTAEARLADAYEAAVKAGEHFALALDGADGYVLPKLFEDFQEAAGKYIADRKAAWQSDYENQFIVDSKYVNAVSDALGRLAAWEGELAYHQGEITRLGRAFDASAATEAVEWGNLETISIKVNDAREQYNQATGAYTLAAEAFAEAGAAYDELYNGLKGLYEATEKARLAYEKQDAIRRWASTSYLAGSEGGITAASYNGPAEELEYARVRYERSAVAVEALKSLYNSGEERRPFENAEYEALYEEYRGNYERMLIVQRTEAAIQAELAREQQRNTQYYENYQSAVSAMAGSLTYTGYTEPERAEDISIRNLLTISENGKLGFAAGDDYTLTVVDEEAAARLQEYLAKTEWVGNERNPASAFETAVRAFWEDAERYGLVDSGGNINAAKYREWGFARDYYVLKIIGANKDNDLLSGYLKTLYEGTEELEEGGNLGGYYVDGEYWYNTLEVHEAAPWYRNDLPRLQEQAWNSLGEEERELMEFYAVLTLLGGGGGLDSGYFGKMSEYYVYEKVYNKFSSWYSTIKKRAKIPFAGYIYRNARGYLESTDKTFGQAYRNLRDKQNNAKEQLKSGTKNLADTLDTYNESNDRIAAMLGILDGQALAWAELEKAFTASGVVSGEDLEKLKGYWEAKTEQEGDEAYTSVAEALAGLSRWSRDEKDNARNSLERRYADLAGDQKTAAGNYREALDQYIDGTISAEELALAAEAAYGAEAAAVKNHYENLEAVLESVLAGAAGDLAGMYGAYQRSAGELVALVQNAYQSRYDAELSARYAAWELESRDIGDKLTAWREAAGLIIERGRNDWKDGLARFEGQYQGWRNEYAEAYERTSGAWAEAYLQGLEDKNAWVARATEAAANRTDGAMISLVGSDAEALGRKFDTRDPLSLAGYGGAEAAGEALRGVLELAGIDGLGNAMASLSGSAATIAGAVRRGMGGIGVWNAGQVQVAAAEMARESNAAIAEAQARIVAGQARDAAEKAIAGLTENVREANAEFDRSIDTTFIMDGQWRRTGKTYIKDIIVHSTLLNPVITEKKTVAVYNEYRLGDVELKTDLSGERLSGMSVIGIDALIAQVFLEIEGKAKEVFGDEEAMSGEAVAGRTVAINNEKRTTGAGLYGAHIGYSPVTRNKPDIEKGRGGVFEDQGTGELGRLMTEYIYWSMKQQAGLELTKSAPWDKPIWDSRGSFISAPNIRSVANIGMTVVAATAGAALTPFTGGASLAASVALGVALNVADDAVFAALDVAGGYKSWEDAGVTFGKAALTATVTSVAGAGFSAIGGGISAAKGTLDYAVAQGMVKATETWTTSLATSAINAVTYSGGSFGFDTNAFTGGVQSGLIAGAVSGTATLTSGILGTYNLYDSTLEYLSNKTFKSDSIASLNTMIGGTVGQAVNYALGNDFTLNLLDAGFLGVRDIEGNSVGTGLLELGLGRKGTSLGLGTGGVNVSINQIMSGVEGVSESLEVLKKKYGSDLDRLNLSVSNALGYTKNEQDWALGRGLFLGEREYSIESLTKGLATVRDGGIVVDDRLITGSDKETAAQLAMILAHEDTHIWGGSEQDAYLREMKGYEELKNAWGVVGTGMISGIGEASAYYATYGEEAILEMLAWQGLFDTGDTPLQGTILDPTRQIRINAQYGYHTTLEEIQKIYQSELGRQMLENHEPIRAAEMAGFLMGESTRLGVVSKMFGQQLDDLHGVMLNSRALEATLLERAGNNRRILESMGINPDKEYSIPEALLTGVRLTMEAVGQEYINFLLGQSIEGIANAAGIESTWGFSGVAADGIMGRDINLESVVEGLIDGAIRQNGGRYGNQIASALGLLKTDIKAGYASYMVINKLLDAQAGYYDAMTQAQTAGQGLGYAQQKLAELSGVGMMVYDTASQFMSGLLGADATSQWTNAGNYSTTYFNNILMNEAQRVFPPHPLYPNPWNTFYDNYGYEMQPYDLPSYKHTTGTNFIMNMTRDTSIERYFRAQGSYTDSGTLYVSQYFDTASWSATGLASTGYWNNYLENFRRSMPGSRQLW